MRNLFTFVFSAGLGLAAAVGATSLSFNSFTTADKVAGAQVGGVELGGQNVAFEADGGDISVNIPHVSDATISFFEVRSLGDPFEFSSFELSTEDPGGAPLLAVGLLNGSEVVSQLFEATTTPSVVTASAFAGQPVDQLRFSAGGPGGFGGSGDLGSGSGSFGGSGGTNLPTLLVFDDADDGAGLSLDDLEFASVSTVPVPASVLLLGTALLGIGVMRRRRKS